MIRIACRALVLVLSSTLVVAPSRAAERRPFEVADYFRTAFVGAPVLSPDGSKIVVTVTRYELEAGESWSEIWVMGADGGEWRQLTRGRHHDGSPAFSPDGSTLAFLSDRDEHGTQIYLLPMEGGDAYRLTSFNPAPMVSM